MSLAWCTIKPSHSRCTLHMHCSCCYSTYASWVLLKKRNSSNRLHKCYCSLKSYVSKVCWVRIPAEVRILFSASTSRPTLGLFMWTVVGEWNKSTTEVKNAWSFISMLQHAFIIWCSGKYTLMNKKGCGRKKSWHILSIHLWRGC
jgi:hypothetical protein